MENRRAMRRGCRVLVVVTLALALSLSSHLCIDANAEQKEVRVGVLLPLSGFLATSGEWILNGIKLAVEDINKQGGIASMGGAKLKIIATDSTGKPDVGMGEAERLILREKVCAILGAYQSSVTFTSSSVAEKYKVPYLVATAVKSEITQREGFNYVFRHVANGEGYASNMVKSFHEVAGKSGYKFQNAAVVGENTDFGQELDMYLTQYLNKHNIKIIARESYPLTITDVSPIITKLMIAKPDVVFLTGYVADTILMVKTAAAMKFKVPFVSSGGENNPTFLKQVGNLADCNFVRGTFNLELAKTKPSLKDIVDRYKDRYGMDMTTEASNNYCVPFILKDALERAKTDDPKKLRDALAATDIPEGQSWMTDMNERITFDKHGQNPRPPFILMQYHDAKLRVVWPKKHEMSTPVLPKP